jgi:hypothetical protein
MTAEARRNAGDYFSGLGIRSNLTSKAAIIS